MQFFFFLVFFVSSGDSSCRFVFLVILFLFLFLFFFFLLKSTFSVLHGVISIIGILHNWLNVYITNWKDPPFFMGKSTISTGPFSIAFCMFTRGYQPWGIKTSKTSGETDDDRRPSQQDGGSV